MYEDLMSLLMESKAELMQAKGHLMKEELGCQPKECINNEWIKYDLLGAEGLAEDFSTYFFNGYSSYLHTNALDQLKTISNLEELPTIETTITDEDIDNYTNDCYPTGYVDNIKYVAKYLLNMNKA